MIRLSDGYQLMGLMQKGHVAKAVFMLNARKEHEVEVPFKDVEHIHGRWVPSSEQPGSMEFQRSKPGPGAFACTYWEK